MSYGPPFPDGLTHDADKQRYFGTDSYFLESYEQLGELTGDAVEFAAGHALLLLKPDAIASRSVGPVLDWVRASGFRIVAARRFRMTRGAVRAMWHYQLNRATPARCRLADALCQASDSLVLLLDAPAGGSVPPSVALSHRKGPADPARRHPDQLRSRLGNFGFLLNLVHASDEPADVLRELGILLDADERRQLVQQALAGTAERRALAGVTLPGADRHHAAAALADQLYAEIPAQDLRFAPAAARLAAAAEALDLPPGPRAELRACLDAADWGGLVELIWRSGLPLTGWDLTIVGCGSLPLSRPEYAQLLRGTDISRWREPADAALS
ncbi:nucleoside-diphosphate kinase [Actinoplanes sp. NPDC026619]|uniref:nucleoside-diphosphate kinase n=1 Tax=Actinoplanes sp. NPDC026619 TaxID=3155798 RepID=UPI0034112CFA